MADKKSAYTVNDRRGKDPKTLPCRVCGCPTVEHSKNYNSPTMECVQYLRGKLGALQDDVRAALNDSTKYPQLKMHKMQEERLERALKNL